jgi:tetratricopeptide (TPR) repeat protein
MRPVSTRILLAALLCGSAAGQEVSGKLEMTLAADGALTASATIAHGRAVDPVGMLAPFVLSLPMSGLPAGREAGESLELRIQAHDPGFMLPFHRQKALRLSVVNLAPDRGAARTGALREEIALDVPAGFTVLPAPQVHREQAIGSYHSESSFDGRKLTVTRRLELAEPDTPAAEALLKQVREDQEQVFRIARRRRPDPAAWARTVDPAKAPTYAEEANRAQEFEFGLRLAERAREANPDDPLAATTLYSALTGLSRLKEARAVIEEQAAKDEGVRFYGTALGYLDTREWRWEEAIRNYEQTLAIREGDYSIWSNLAAAYRRVGRWADAAKQSRKTVGLNADDRLDKARAAVDTVCAGEASDPKAALEAALGTLPGPAYVSEVMTLLTDCGKEPELARSYGRRLIESLPLFSGAPRGPSIAGAISQQYGGARVLDRYGWLLARTGAIAEAEPLLESSTMLWLQSETLYHLALVKWGLGKTQEARTLWREITLLEPTRVWADAPEGIAEGLENAPRYSVDGVWYRTETPVGDLSPESGEPWYYFVTVNGAGAVVVARPLDSTDRAAGAMLAEIWKLRFPVVRGVTQPMWASYIVKIARQDDGQVVALRSVTNEAYRIALWLAPEEFPAPAPREPR